jgi:hypothetical protein
MLDGLRYLGANGSNCHRSSVLKGRVDPCDHVDLAICPISDKEGMLLEKQPISKQIHRRVCDVICSMTSRGTDSWVKIEFERTHKQFPVRCSSLRVFPEAPRDEVSRHLAVLVFFQLWRVTVHNGGQLRKDIRVCFWRIGISPKAHLYHGEA